MNMAEDEYEFSEGRGRGNISISVKQTKNFKLESMKSTIFLLIGIIQPAMDFFFATKGFDTSPFYFTILFPGDQLQK